MNRNWFIRIGDGLSGLCNVIFLNGECDESVSGRTYRCGWKTAESYIDFILGIGHCKEAYLGDLARANELINSHKQMKNNGK
jgi:hypothetical protein